VSEDYSLDHTGGYGRAALLLVESLIHGLVERELLTVREAVEIMEAALEAQVELVEDATNPSASMRQASTLLASLVASLQNDAV